MTKLREFNDWLETATPGQVFTYHTGTLASDRGHFIVDKRGDPIFMSCGDINDVAKAAYSAFTQQKVHLFQRKLHDNEYQYLAVKRSPYSRNW